MYTTNASGSFLVRESTSSNGNYSLSIRDAKKVRHHKIQKLGSGGYFVTPQVTFTSVPELVTYYRSSGFLKNPCITEKPQNARSSGNLYHTKYLCVAKYNFSSERDGDLSFKKGDLLYIINDDHDGWWFAKAKHSDQEGFIPSNYVEEFKSLEAEE